MTPTGSRLRPERAIVEIGHAFEWAFLLSEAQELFPEEDLLERVRLASRIRRAARLRRRGWGLLPG